MAKHLGEMEFLLNYGEAVPETQCGFRGNRSTVDMIFCLRQLQEKCIEQDRPLYMVFVNLSKAFDAVWRTGLWQVLRKYGCPKKFTTMFEALHTGMMANVSVAGSSTSSYQQCSTRLSETYGPDRALIYSTSHTSERRPRLVGY
ncbi:hypothetical protein NP493_619g02035 [Ridgeia piscesae]|uniref:Reverse transcriptase domain-containing protein n=1 Tax=Ridgeia piscesae TaxID=27915 RepID=A0AAD9KTM1_RIDPI|nr:hypothetical protein NP493_619g02035 [Ridgeia piscesae]